MILARPLPRLLVAGRRAAQAISRRLAAATRPAGATLVGGALADAARSRSALIAEHTLLRHRLGVVRRQVKRPRCTPADRALLALLDALDALGGRTALHLSTLLCGAHRRAVLKKVRRRLAEGEPCLLVATQVVEAGVDLDFPLALRALGPLDRVVQAAGRCNREGRLAGKGRMVIFEPEEGRQPPGIYRTGTDTTRVLLNATDDGLDLHDPDVYVDYFQRFYRGVDLDRERVQKLRQQLDYPEVARCFRLIDDEGVPIVVRHRGDDGTGRTSTRCWRACAASRSGVARSCGACSRTWSACGSACLIGRSKRDGRWRWCPADGDGSGPMTTCAAWAATGWTWPGWW